MLGGGYRLSEGVHSGSLEGRRGGYFILMLSLPKVGIRDYLSLMVVPCPHE